MGTAAALLGVLVPLGFLAHAWSLNGALGFPLDDAWIHLNYARTLREHGTFAYFPGAPPSAGSTAPLFTLLEAVGFLVTSNEKLLAILLGLAAHAGFLVAFARWAEQRLGDARWTALAVGLVALDGRVALLAVSGMETSLFLALTALAIERRLAGRALASGLALGAALWVRPDAAILAAVFAIDTLLGDAGAASAATGGGRDGKVRSLGAFALVALAYAGLNLALSGHPLPATFAAKTAYYATRPRSAFLTGDVAECFGSGAWVVFAPFALIACGLVVHGLVRRRRPTFRIEAGWAAALPLAYLIFLPYSHRFTRYLVPALPALAILGVAGLQAIVRARAVSMMLRRLVLVATLVAAVALHARLLAESADFYAFACRYHAERHEQAGRWLAAHTPPDAVVATHDVGAIAYYSRRRIVDAAGLVSPEVTPWIGKSFYPDSLTALFDRRGVTHVAAFEDWLPIGGVPPLVVFNTEPEVMRIYPWVPGRTQVLPVASAPPAAH